MSIRSFIRDAFRMQSDSSQHESRWPAAAYEWTPSGEVIRRDFTPEEIAEAQRQWDAMSKKVRPYQSPFAVGGRLHFAAGNDEPKMIPKLMPDQEPWGLLQEIGIAYEVALGAILTCVKNGDIDTARLYVPRILKVVQRSDHRDPDGRRVLKLYSETCYCHMTRAERVLLGIDDGIE